MGWRDRLALALTDECSTANSADSAGSSPARGGAGPIGTTGAIGIETKTPKRGEAVPLAAPPGTPAEWAAGMARLAVTPPPASIAPARWAVFQADAARLLAEHVATLAAADWDVLDVFGLHRGAPGARMDAAGLAWLLHGRELGSVDANAATIRTPSGAMLTAHGKGAAARTEAAPAWALGDMTEDGA